jgi:hypothetical protein
MYIAFFLKKKSFLSEKDQLKFLNVIFVVVEPNLSIMLAVLLIFKHLQKEKKETSK